MKELILELSHNCNLACTMCGFGAQPLLRERFMTWETLDRVLDGLDVEPEVVRLNGRGESTIHPHFVDMLQHVRERLPRAGINLFTHLSIPKPHIVEALLAHDVQLFVSMDGADASTFESIRRRGRFALVMANLARLDGLSRRPFVIFTLQEDNFDQLVPMARLAVDKRLHLLVNTVRRDEGIEPFVEMVESGRGQLQRDYAAVVALFEGTGLQVHLPDRIHGIPIRDTEVTRTYGGREACPAIATELCIHFDGTVTPCNMFNPYEYGNLLETPLPEIRAGQAATWFRENHKSHPYCQNCACLGGTA